MNASRKSRSREFGFTLIEIMVVVVIIGLLAVTVTTSVLKDQDVATLNRVRQDIATLDSSIEKYYLYERKYPESLDDLTVEDEDGNVYLKRLAQDPWDNDYVLEPNGRKYVIRCYGADGEPDTDDDITNKNMADFKTLPKSR